MEPPVARETVELVTKVTYWSDDNWQTIWRVSGEAGGKARRVTGPVELAKVRMLAVFKYGGGRDEDR